MISALVERMAGGELPEEFPRLFVAVNWVMLALLAAGAGVVASPRAATGVLIGGVLANLNLRGLERDCRRVVAWGSVAAYYAGLAVRMGLLALAVTILFLFLPRLFSPIGLFVGLSVGIINFYILTATIVIKRVRYKEAA